MKEQLYTIPVNEAFDKDCECPVCAMYESLEQGALEFTLGPSYMEDDIRMVTDKVGFCDRHIEKMYERGNRLGLALMMKTHADRTINEVKKLAGSAGSGKTGLFKKSTDAADPLARYLQDLEDSCFVCDRINNVFERYLDTMFYLYHNDSAFQNKLKNSKGFCNRHLKDILNRCRTKLDAKEAKDFAALVTDIYIKNMERVRDDLSWFIDKFDYRHQDDPWKDSKDAPQRMMMKQDSVFYENPQN